MLGECLTEYDVLEALESIPRTLEGVYERILLRQNDCKWRRISRRILYWVSFSVHKLNLKELAELVALDSESSHFDPRKRLQDPLHVLKYCPGLIRADEYGSYEVAHFSVKEYLSSASILLGPAATYYLEDLQSHTEIAIDCLWYITQIGKSTDESMWPATTPVDSDYNAEKKLWEGVQKSLLMDDKQVPLMYTAAEWFYYAEFVEEAFPEQLRGEKYYSLATNLFFGNHLCTLWILIYTETQVPKFRDFLAWDLDKPL